MDLTELNKKYCPAVKMTKKQLTEAIKNKELPHKYHGKYLKTARIIDNVFALLEKEQITQSKAIELTTAILAELCEGNQPQQSDSNCNIPHVSNNELNLDNLIVKIPATKSRRYKLTPLKEEVSVCGYFTPDTNTTSATICKICGHEKNEHQQTDC